MFSVSISLTPFQTMTNPLTPIEGTAVTDNSDATDTSYANEHDYDYRRIASSQRRLLLTSFLLWFLLPCAFALVLALAMVLPESIAGFVMLLLEIVCVIGGVFLMGNIIFLLVYTVRLARLLNYNISILLFLLCLFVVGLWLVPVLVFLRANSILKEAGYSVGLLGADMRQFGDVEDDGRMTDEFLGLILGLALTVIVFGSVFLFFYAR